MPQSPGEVFWGGCVPVNAQWSGVPPTRHLRWFPGGEFEVGAELCMPEGYFQFGGVYPLWPSPGVRNREEYTKSCCADGVISAPGR